YRACHTLSGSSKMAQARHGIRLAEPLDHWLRRAFASGAGLGGEELTLLQDCMAAMESVATHLDEPTGYFVNHWQLLERIERADKGLEQRIAGAAAHAAPPGARAHRPPPPPPPRAPPRPPAPPPPRAPPATSIPRWRRSSPTRPPTSSTPPS